MKNFKFWLTCLIGLVWSQTFSQVTVDNNNGSGINFVGFNNLFSFPLNIRNDGNTQINIASNSNNKFRITEQGTWNGLNGLTRNNVQRTTMGLQGQTTLAWSMLHLFDDAAAAPPTTLQRPWMNVGASFTSNQDFMYSGLLERPVTGGPGLLTDAVIAWGCQDGATNSDNFRFLFITPTNGTTPAGSQQGLEIMRIAPIGNVGIGDFSSMPNGIGGATPIYGQPRARLDVQFRNAIPANTDNTAVNIFNNATDPSSPISLFKIGVDARSITTGIVDNAIGGRFRAERGKRTIGVYASAFGGGNGTSVGVESIVQEADGELQHYGVLGRARTATENIGVYGQGLPSATNAFATGIWGETTGGGLNTWAGYFNGRVFHAGALVPSDEFLKHDIVNVENATEILSQLVPKRYYYNQDTQLNLPVELQYGLLAQEVEAALPSLVSTITTPTFVDSTGQATSEPLTFKAMRYNDLTAILIAGFNEQAGTVANQAALIEEQNAEIIELKSQLQEVQQQMAYMNTAVLAMQAKTNNCCNDGSTGSLQAPASKNDGVKLMQNVPNPFDTQTRIDFTLPADAYVVLELSDAQGRPLRRLVDGQMNAGPQTITLDGSSLAPGMYYYTVYANGELLTKKMVKK